MESGDCKISLIVVKEKKAEQKSVQKEKPLSRRVKTRDSG